MAQTKPHFYFQRGMWTVELNGVWGKGFSPKQAWKFFLIRCNKTWPIGK